MRYDAELIRLNDKTYGVLRNAEPSEGGKMLELMRTCAGETEYLIHYPDEIIRSDESEAAFIQMTNESDGTLMLVCDIDGEIVGFCSLNCAGMKKSKVRHRASVGISVISKYWGKGLGTIMMNALEKQAKTMGISQMELEFIEGNDRAKCLYEKLGYRVTGELPNAIHSREGRRLGMFTMIKEI